MKIVYKVILDTDSRNFSVLLDEENSPKETSLSHSGSSYFRMKINGCQIGTIGSHCDAGLTTKINEYEKHMMDYNHVVFALQHSGLEYALVNKNDSEDNYEIQRGKLDNL